MTTVNPLHNYRSYSYHHILIACDNTSTAEQLANLQGADLSGLILDRPGIQSSNINDLIADKVSINEGTGNYFVVINTMTDAELYIKRASWQTFIVPRIDTGSPETTSLTSMAVEGQITVGEPKGVRFLNIINNIGVVLETGPIGLTFMLKTVFIGFKDGIGSSLPEYITDIKPFLFYMTDITAVFDEGGGEYEISLLGQSNGAANSEHFTNIAIPPLEIKTAENTLSKVFEILQDTIQTTYDAGIVLAKKEFRESNPGEELVGREIKYIITLDKKYTHKDYTVDNLTIANQGLGTDDPVISFGRYQNIMSMIQHVMSLCTKVNTDASGTTQGKMIYKVHTALITNPKTVEIKFFITSFVVAESIGFGSTELLGGTNGEIIELDYLYSGKNIDIMEFDIKMEMGLAFFQLLSVTPQTKDNRSAVGSGETVAASNSTGTKVDLQPKGVLLPNHDSNDKFKKNYNNVISAANFKAALHKHASLETLEAKIKIHGNPRLLKDFNTLPSDMGKDLLDNPGSTITPNYQKFPSLVKINIFMPSGNTLTGSIGDTYAEEFWYKGLYTILSIDHVFENNGLFTQELHLLSVPEVIKVPVDKDAHKNQAPTAPLGQGQ